MIESETESSFFFFFILLAVAVVELVELLWTDTLELLTWEGTEKSPGDIQSVDDVTIVIWSLSDEGLLELSQEVEVEVILSSQGFLSDDGLHGRHVLSDGIIGIQLVGDRSVILSGVSNGGLHKTREGWEHVDWWVDLLVVELTIDVDLSLSNVSSKIRNWMGNIVIWHGKNWDLGDRSTSSLDTSGSLVDGGEISVHVSGVSTTSGHLFSGGRHLTKGIGIRRHIGEDDQNVLVALVGEILGGSEGETWGDDTLNGWIIGQVEEEGDTFHRSVLLEILLEKASSIHVNSHSGEDNSEGGLCLSVGSLDDKTGLSANLGGNLIVRKSSSREDRNLLSTGNGVHSVDSGDSSLDHLLWVDTLSWVNWLSLDIKEILSQDIWSLVNWLSRSVEDTSEHVLRDWHLENLSGELAAGVLGINSGGSLENLDDGLLSVDLKDLSLSLASVSKSQVDDLSEFWELDVVKNDERSIDSSYSSVVKSWVDMIISEGSSGMLLESLVLVVYWSVG